VTTDQSALQVYTCNGVEAPVPIPRKRSQGGPSTTYMVYRIYVLSLTELLNSFRTIVASSSNRRVTSMQSTTLTSMSIRYTVLTDHMNGKQLILSRLSSAA
jgi:hypothetical protein